MFDLSTLKKDQLESVDAVRGFLHLYSSPGNDRVSCRDYLEGKAVQLEIIGNPKDIVRSAIADIMFGPGNKISYNDLINGYEVEQIVGMVQRRLTNIAEQQSAGRGGGRSQ